MSDSDSLGHDSHWDDSLLEASMSTSSREKVEASSNKGRN